MVAITASITGTGNGQTLRQRLSGGGAPGFRSQLFKLFSREIDDTLSHGNKVRGGVQLSQGMQKKLPYRQ